MGHAPISALDDCHGVAIRRRMAPIALRAWLEPSMLDFGAHAVRFGLADFGCIRTTMHEFRR